MEMMIREAEYVIKEKAGKNPLKREFFPAFLIRIR
jgi:hypothetical protein